jgi:stage III sporulation protein AH
MNAKKQTIWLVSMLGLMVILSAYYLFTEDPNQLPNAIEPVTLEDIEVVGTQTTDSQADALIIEQLESDLQGNDAITTMQMNRNSDFSQKLEDLTAKISSSDATEQQIEEALNKHDALIDLETRLIAFEEKLLTDYENVVVTYDEDHKHYTVNVYATELQRNEAVSIVRQALDDLNIAVHQISVRLFR